MAVKFLAILVLIALPLMSSCGYFDSKRDELYGPKLYEKYEERVNELRIAVESGEMTVTEAENARHQAYLDYMNDLRDTEVARQEKSNA